jgi:hypothetical protein
MVRWRRARRPVRQGGLPVWAEPTMLAELHALKLPVGTDDSPPAGGRRARLPAKPANYITVMMRRAGSGAVPRIVLSALRLGRGDSVSQIGLMLTRSILAAGASAVAASLRLLSAISIRTFEFASGAIISFAIRRWRRTIK